TSMANGDLSSIAISGFDVSGGAQVSLPAVTSIAGGQLSADGTGSTIDVPALTTFNSQGVSPQITAALDVTHGGSVLDDALTKLDDVDLILDGTGTITIGITIAGTSPGSFGQLSATGPVNLNDARLQLAHTGATLIGSTFAILNSTDAINGTFQGLPEG